MVLHNSGFISRVEIIIMCQKIKRKKRRVRSRKRQLNINYYVIHALFVSITYICFFNYVWIRYSISTNASASSSDFEYHSHFTCPHCFSEHLTVWTEFLEVFYFTGPIRVFISRYFIKISYFFIEKKEF